MMTTFPSHILLSLFLFNTVLGLLSLSYDKYKWYDRLEKLQNSADLIYAPDCHKQIWARYTCNPMQYIAIQYSENLSSSELTFEKDPGANFHFLPVWPVHFPAYMELIE